jgi:hypothetical protein
MVLDATSDKAMYLAFIEDVATHPWFLLFHDMGPFPKINM